MNVSKDFEYTKQETARQEHANLSWWKKTLFAIRGRVAIGMRQPKGFTAHVEFFLVQCENCGPILTYPRTHREWIRCSRCLLKESETRTQGYRGDVFPPHKADTVTPGREIVPPE